MFTTIIVEGGNYRVSIEIANRIQYLERCIAALEASGKYAKAEKCRQHIYDIIDNSLKGWRSTAELKRLC